MNDYEFGNFLYELRKKRGLTQKELGDKLGVKNKAVSQWEMGISKPRTGKLRTLAEILGVTVDELLACKRAAPKEDARSEIAFAINVHIREIRRARRWLVFGIVLFLAAPTLAFLTVAVSVGTIDTAQSGVTIGLAAFFGALFCLSCAVIAASGITMSKRKRMLYRIFPKRREEIDGLTGQAAPPEVGEKETEEDGEFRAREGKRLGLILPVAVLLAVLATLAALVCQGILAFWHAILLACAAAAALFVGNAFLTVRLVAHMRKRVVRGDYERAIGRGKFLLGTWLPCANMQIADTVCLNLAVAYFSIGKDEAFRAYLADIDTPFLSVAKSYWMCIAALAQRDAGAFREAYASVMFPEAAKTYRDVAGLAADYGKLLCLMAELVDGAEPEKAKKALLDRIENPRARRIIGAY